MAIELKQQLRLTQQLVMTPQLQQAIKLLQLNQMELVNLVEQELQENPCLEEDEREEETPAEISDATPEEINAATSADGEGEPSTPSDEEGGVSEASTETSAELEFDASESVDPAMADADPSSDVTTAEPTDVEKIADVEWDNYMDSHEMTGLETRAGGDDDDRRSLEQTLSRRPTLAEHLSWQLQLSDMGEDERQIAEWIIGNLDERGFLCATCEELARQSNAPIEAVEVVLANVQQLDPTGVASRDLRECLMLQIDALGIDDPLVGKIIDGHLDLLQKRDFRGLTRILDTTIQEVAAAAHVIGNLEPRPARAFGGEDPVYITPDIYVYKIGDEFHILLNEDGLPKLKISNVYKEVLAKGQGKNAGENARDTKSYVQDKVRSAQWLIKSIHQRQRTIYKVMQSIIEYQRDFFDKGVAYLKPLNLRDVADDIEMHESTVSRVTTNKYVHTPQGIYELKYFFNSSISRFDGEAVASESVKEKIRIIIANEDRRRPMSDQRIAEMLKTANIDIARRTVTKYREAMNILSSTKRREVG